jgi:exopolyphosphatase / guanosine-5'-triphosphate,3'-diphosphate pyrophosphatase
MAKQRIAAIDLGTNTFHLLITEVSAGGKWKTIYKERQFVHLGEGGLGHLQDTAMLRGWATLNHFAQQLKKFKVDRYKAIGTSALREADNLDVFLEKTQPLELQIEVIDGLEEARLIHKGVLEATGRLDGRQLIMDIGGGSVEMVITSKGQIEYALSLPLGVAVLYELVKGVDPITPRLISSVNRYIDAQLVELNAKLKSLPCDQLVGASGTFEVLAAFETDPQRTQKCHVLSLANFSVLYDEIISSTLEERLSMPAIPKSRAQLIVVACILIKAVLEAHPFKTWLYSPYAMKEGILSELK